MSTKNNQKNLKNSTAKKEGKPTIRAIEHSKAIKKIEERVKKAKEYGNSMEAISRLTGLPLKEILSIHWFMTSRVLVAQEND